MKKSNQIPSLELLKEVFVHFPEVQAVYLFGSRATGKSNLNSDLDLAIVPRTPSAREKRLEILHQLTKAGFDNVDLIFLDGNDIVLKYEAVRSNNLIYHTDDFSRGETYSRIVREFLDFRPYLNVQREAFKRRVLNGKS